MGETYKFGIEEELFIADAMTRSPPREVEGFHRDVHERMPEVERELLQAQVEIMTPPCSDFAAARASLGEQRSGLTAIAREHGMLILASGTNPVARWQRQRRTDKERYAKIADDIQMLARRDAVCGMHVHVEVPDPDGRVDLMNRLLPYTPVLLALSASSPFWESEDTGLHAYRLSVWGEMPRTGLPEIFDDKSHFDRFVAAMVKAGAIRDASFLWWTLRPSMRFPTLELRVADSCTRLDDTLAIAALYRCLVRLVDRTPQLNRGLTGSSRAIVAENMWRAQRRGVHATFLDEEGETMLFPDLLESLIDAVAEDAAELDCAEELARTRVIVSEGTSADRQLAMCSGADLAGEKDRAALNVVVDWIADQTAR